MPTYDYACNACGHSFDRFESIVATPNKSCPKCSRKTAKRRISAGGGLIFKGSGFYITDYKKKSAPQSDACPTATDSKTCNACPHSDKSEKSKQSKSAVKV
ncbi:MAG: zinc ribbon domain-containing protein [Planctomycetota bacterium]